MRERGCVESEDFRREKERKEIVEKKEKTERREKREERREKEREDEREKREDSREKEHAGGKEGGEGSEIDRESEGAWAVPASVQMALHSAPDALFIFSATFMRLMPRSRFMRRLWMPMMSARDDTVGLGNSIFRSMRPGRSSAESKMSMRFVAMMTCGAKGGRSVG